MVGPEQCKFLIMNKEVKPELALLLAENGCDISTDSLYVNNSLIYANGRKCNWNREEDYNDFPEPISAPTIADVVMWLYEKHKIWVSVSVDTLFNKGKFCIVIYKDKGLGLENYPLDNTEFSPYESPTEAYEVAIEYTLTKLI
jgi:hypothetical protein